MSPEEMEIAARLIKATPEAEALSTLAKRTIDAKIRNSILLFGPRDSGKTLLTQLSVGKIMREHGAKTRDFSMLKLLSHSGYEEFQGLRNAIEEKDAFAVTVFGIDSLAGQGALEERFRIPAERTLSNIILEHNEGNPNGGGLFLATCHEPHLLSSFLVESFKCKVYVPYTNIGTLEKYLQELGLADARETESLLVLVWGGLLPSFSSLTNAFASLDPAVLKEGDAAKVAESILERIPDSAFNVDGGYIRSYEQLNARVISQSRSFLAELSPSPRQD